MTLIDCVRVCVRTRVKWLRRWTIEILGLIVDISIESLVLFTQLLLGQNFLLLLQER